MKKLIFGFFLKTYINDIKYVERLIKSFNRFNCDDIKMVLMCPKSDSHQFQKVVSKNQNIIVYEEETLIEFLIDEKEIKNFNSNSSLGYLNQALLKLCFWELEIFENYFCIDSEFVFIKDFYLEDFMFDDNIPYTTLIEDNEWKVHSRFYDYDYISRDKSLEKIKNFMKISNDHFLTIHGNCTLSSIVLKKMKIEILNKHNISYKDLIKISPYEFSWYSFFLQKNQTIKIVIREPVLKLFFNPYQYNEYLSKGIKVDDLKKGYLGYIINSNFSRHEGVINYESLRNGITFKSLVKLTFLLFHNYKNFILNKINFK
tara:strand:+ start:7689 stop:8633 length:945 start_codon:yes stop_codon:yes gene_type:complete